MSVNPSWETSVSIESTNFPGRLLRQRNFLAELDPAPPRDDLAGQADATFTVVAGLANSMHVSFASRRFPNYYLRHQDFRLKVHERVLGDALFDADATFSILPDGWGT